jgi:hypothetical protein
VFHSHSSSEHLKSFKKAALNPLQGWPLRRAPFGNALYQDGSGPKGHDFLCFQQRTEFESYGKPTLLAAREDRIGEQGCFVHEPMRFVVDPVNARERNSASGLVLFPGQTAPQGRP